MDCMRFPAGSLAFLLVAASIGAAQTKVVMLGTGTPYPDPERSGPAAAVVVNGVSYLVDCGPGVVRRLAAAQKKGIEGIGPNKVHQVFITHLHSDHTLGYPDIMLSPAVTGRKGGLDVYGPVGLEEMTKDLLQAWSKDIDVRLHGMEHGHADAYVVHAHDVQPGVVYKDANVTVTAFPVKHGSWDEALGYKFVTKDRVIVFSGDTAPTDEIAKECDGCDLLIHEVYPTAYYNAQPESDKPYFRVFHVSTAELAKIANDAKPKVLVLDHVLWGKAKPEDVMKEIEAAGYAGKIVVANDLDVYRVGDVHTSTCVPVGQG